MSDFQLDKEEAIDCLQFVIDRLRVYSANAQVMRDHASANELGFMIADATKVQSAIESGGLTYDGVSISEYLQGTVPDSGGVDRSDESVTVPTA